MNNQHDLSQCRILIVDDVKANIDILVNALRNDYKISVALNGKQALKVARRQIPDLILLDVIMPELNGYEVCRQLRAAPETAEIPIMFLTALDEVENKTTGFEVGGNDYVTKPFEILEVKARVKSLLQARAYLTAKAEVLAKELEIAHDIQMGLIPKDFSKIRDHFKCDIYGLLKPARQVGGDFYDVFSVGQNSLCFVIGDVSDKGVPAALFMAVTRTLIRATARESDSPAKILSVVNDQLAAENPRTMFVTLFLAIIDFNAATMRAACGGHTQPIILRRDKPAEYLLDHPGTIVGAVEGLNFTENHWVLEPGDLIIAYTDGVTEAMNSKREMFGDERLLQLLQQTAKPDPQAGLDQVVELTATGTVTQIDDAVRRFTGDAPQSDDIGILAFHWPNSSANHVWQTELQSSAHSMMEAIHAFKTWSESIELDKMLTHDLMLCVEELMANIIHHGYNDESGHWLKLSASCASDRIEIYLYDRAPAFNPLTKELIELSSNWDDKAIGGMGLHLVRELADHINYDRKPGLNRTKLTKYRRTTPENDT